MNKKIKVSIIVPIYNAEKYIETCINSLINQTYKNIEIILVDDESPDNCPKICDEYAKKDSRIKVHHQKNGGPSVARNNGLKLITGEYIAFVDSDDYIHEKYIEILLNNLIKTKSDLSVCGVIKTKMHGEKSNEIINNNDCLILNQKETYKNMILNNQVSGYLCNKMYTVNILNKMKDKEIKDFIFEDFEFNTRYVELCKKTCITNNKLYYYFTNPEGFTGTKKVSVKTLNGTKAYELIQKKYNKNAPEYEDYIAFENLRFRLNINYRCYIHNNTPKFNYKNKDLYKQIIKSKTLSIKKKIYIIISYNFPILSSWAKSKLNKNNSKRGKYEKIN